MAFTDRLHNRGSISTGYDIDNSLKFEEDNSESLWKTFSSEGTGTGKTFTISGWVKRTELGGIDIVMGVGRAIGSDANDGAIRFNSDQFQFVNFASNAYNVRTNAVFRDTSAWYHIMVAVDTTQATDSNRVKLYVNGEQQTSLTGTAYPTQNYQFKWGRAEEHMIGARPDSDGTAGVAIVSQFWSGYMSDVYFVDGQQLVPTDFGEYDDDSGIWKPKAYTGTFGNNGFYLDFENSGSLGADSSGNSNDFTLNNITSADQATDTPTNNFCILNANSALPTSGYYMIVSEGGTLVQKSGGANWTGVRGSIGINGGKWYWEATRTGTNNTAFGIVQISDSSWSGGSTIFSLLSNGRLYGAGTSPYLTAPPSFSFTDGDIVAIALDLDNQRAYLSKNGVWQNSADPANGTNPINLSLPDEFVLPWTASFYSEPTMKFNFGGYTIASISSAESDENGYGTFEYAPPSGYYALCTKNLAEYG